MRIDASGGAISMDIYVGQNGSWRLTTAWATTSIVADGAEFRQRAESDGLWLSLSLKQDGVGLTVHEGGTKTLGETFYKRLSLAESRQIIGLRQ